MKQTLSVNQFIDAFKNMGREENFGRASLRKLFEYLQEIESDCGKEIELDVIAICCEWAEGAPKDILKEYGLDSFDELRDETTVLGDEDDDLIVYQPF